MSEVNNNVPPVQPTPENVPPTPTPNNEGKGGGICLAALICGIGGIVLAQPLAAIAAIILGVKGRKDGPEEKKGMATAGLITGIIGSATSVIMIICLVSLMASSWMYF